MLRLGTGINVDANELGSVLGHWSAAVDGDHRRCALTSGCRGKSPRRRSKVRSWIEVKMQSSKGLSRGSRAEKRAEAEAGKGGKRQGRRKRAPEESDDEEGARLRETKMEAEKRGRETQRQRQ